MGIRKEILNDVRRQGAEEKQKELEQSFEQKQKITILNLQKEGFSNDKIAMFMGLAVEEIERLTKIE